jgi:glutaredoxin
MSFSHNGISLRALTRNCEPKRKAQKRRENNVVALSPLALALSRTNALVYGAPHCLKCRAAKALLHFLFGSSEWQSHHVDVSLAKNCLQSVGVKTVPTWEINGKRFGGIFDANRASVTTGAHVGELVGWTVLQRKVGSEREAEKMVFDARRRNTNTNSSTSSNSDENSSNNSKKGVDVTYLGGASLGDVARGAWKTPGRRRTRTRTRRRSGWCKRVAVRLAMRGEGKFWCEFGELRSEKSEKRARNAHNVALEPM